MEAYARQFNIDKHDIANAGTIASLTKRELKKRGLTRDFVKKVTIGIYEADTNPHAKKGADLLDIGGKVEYIGINSPLDGKTELASIKEESLVSSLVEMVLNEV